MLIPVILDQDPPLLIMKLFAEYPFTETETRLKAINPSPVVEIIFTGLFISRNMFLDVSESITEPWKSNVAPSSMKSYK